MTPQLKVAIIGAGPSGLVTARFLLHAHSFFSGLPPVEVVVFEQSGHVGGTFHLRVYEDAELVSSKYLTAFSDFRLPVGAPDFVTPARYCEYLKDYADTYGITPHIKFHSNVLGVSRTADGKHAVTYTNGSQDPTTRVFDCLAVCTGMHTNPVMPLFPGVENVPVVLHSSQVKTRARFGQNTNVLVLGAGETGLDMAHLAVTSDTKRVVLSHRNGFFCGPKIVPRPIVLSGLLFKESTTQNKPVDCSVASLFDTAYVPPILQKSPLLWWYYDTWIKTSQTMISGTPNGPDQWAGIMDKKRNHVNSVFFVKTPHALSYISAGRRSKSLWNRMRAALINVPIKDTGDRRIETAPWPKELGKEGLVFEKPADASLAGFVPDVVVFATGYKREIPWLDAAEYGTPMTADVRGVYSSKDISVAFIGFQRPSLGAIPPLAEMQAQLWVYRLMQHTYPLIVPAHFPHSIPPYELDYSLHSRSGYDLATLKGGVDHESYAYQLAVDIGAAPQFLHVWRLSKSWRLLYTWAMGANFNTKFRLVGPWKMEREAVEIMEEELYGITSQTGGLVLLGGTD
ncbi:hypothetical protein TD95_001641 [Thielaviopsis punctulata]|uniref:FAD/NAD(P)-binding domain-containing protein n=1 Tax=Thielaviopsis punctulata TaxID=72032 RepID=A0A0F4Z9Y5_9PEZI|nr:hypothetical protein TD95_001641 [Thielaviopsis punctulata]